MKVSSTPIAYTFTLSEDEARLLRFGLVSYRDCPHSMYKDATYRALARFTEAGISDRPGQNYDNCFLPDNK